MLPRANRVVDPVDFRIIVRRGRHLRSRYAVVHILSRNRTGPNRFGFVVGKVVGNAVKRNRLRRRLRSLCRSFVHEIGSGIDVVVVALPGCGELDWSTLHKEITDVISKDVIKS
ncbi:MAG: ribonuclease P protein component [Rhodoglobus sp.]